MERYIGLDAHGASCTFGVIGPSGRKLRRDVVETNGAALVSYLRSIPGKKHLCLEEGAQSAWLYEILSPHVEEIVVRIVEISDVFVPTLKYPGPPTSDKITLCQLRPGPSANPEPRAYPENRCPRTRIPDRPQVNPGSAPAIPYSQSWSKPKPVSIPSASGSNAAGAMGGARDGRPRHSRILRIASGECSAAMIRSRPWHAGHSRTSTANTRCINSAHE